MAWLCVFDNSYKDSQMCIVTGPNIDIATKLIKRLKGIFETKLGILFQDKETVLNLNGCNIEAYPSNHLDSYRALTNPKFILLDECDMFRKSEQEDVSPSSNKIIPIAFNRDHKQMISHLVSLFEDDYIAIAEKYDKLIISLKTAYVNEYALDTEATSYSDSFDALRLSLKCYNIN
jgi:hypothetical protein